MVLLALCGTALAIGHHIYYKTLDGNIVPEAETQQWAIRFGSAFAFSAISLLKISIMTACTQFTWVILRHKPISIQSIDKMFAITSDPIGIWSMELVKEAKIWVMLAIFSWYVFVWILHQIATNSRTT